MYASNGTDAVNSVNMEQSFSDDAHVTECNGDNHQHHHHHHHHHQNMNTANRMDIGDPIIPSTKTDLSNLKVTVGIDEDLQMILEMDPSIVDLVRTNFLPLLFSFLLVDLLHSAFLTLLLLKFKIIGKLNSFPLLSNVY